MRVVKERKRKGNPRRNSPSLRLVLAAQVLFGLMFCTEINAGAGTRISPAALRCVFKMPLEVGASVTGKIGETIPFYGALEHYLFGVKSPDYRGSPSQYFISHYRSQDLVELGKWEYREGRYRPRNLAISMTDRLAETGSGQIDSLLHGRNTRLFAQSSLIVGVDLFYWDAIRDNCGYGTAWTARMDRGRKGAASARMDTEFQVSQLISRAKNEGKVLMLGTLPYEDPQKILINSRATGIPGFWYPQQYACVESINATLRAECKVRDRCYLVEMDKLVRDLNGGRSISVESLHEEIGLSQARPDGVHLSHLGSMAVAERMIEAFERDPPACPGERNGRTEKIPEISSEPEAGPESPAG